jgi:hypothetical protein
MERTVTSTHRMDWLTHVKGRLLLEQIYPYVIALGCAVTWSQWATGFPQSEALLGATLTVSGILIGFLATSKALMLSLDSKVLDDLRTSGYIQELVGYLGQAIWANLLFCALCVVGFFVERSAWYGGTWIAFSVAALVTFARITHIMLKVFRHSSRQNRRQRR